MNRRKLAEQNIKQIHAGCQGPHAKETVEALVMECFTYSAELLRDLGASDTPHSYSEVAAILEQHGVRFFEPTTNEEKTDGGTGNPSSVKYTQKRGKT